MQVRSEMWWIFFSSAVGRLWGRFNLRWQCRIYLGSAAVAVLVIFATW